MTNKSKHLPNLLKTTPSLYSSIMRQILLYLIDSELSATPVSQPKPAGSIERVTLNLECDEFDPATRYLVPTI